MIFHKEIRSRLIMFYIQKRISVRLDMVQVFFGRSDCIKNTKSNSFIVLFLLFNVSVFFFMFLSTKICDCQQEIFLNGEAGKYLMETFYISTSIK